jgi:hypothetical protein
MRSYPAVFDSGIRLAKVVRAYPEGHSVDLVMFDDNSPVAGVQVMSGQASNRSGASGLIAPTAPPDGEWGNQDSSDENITAVVAYMRGEPMVLGFLRPQVNQLSFGDKNRITYRFPSDVYVTCDQAGNFELSHPGGAYLRLATTPGHESLSGKDADGGWNRDRNTGAKIHIHIEQGGGVASLNIDPDGNINLDHAGNLTTVTGGNLSATVAGTTNVVSGGNTTVTTPVLTINGNVIINGSLTQGKGSNGGNCQMQGPLNVVQDVTAGSISLMHHTHPGDSGGTTGQPNG